MALPVGTRVRIIDTSRNPNIPWLDDRLIGVEAVVESNDAEHPEWSIINITDGNPILRGHWSVVPSQIAVLTPFPPRSESQPIEVPSEPFPVGSRVRVT